MAKLLVGIIIGIVMSADALLVSAFGMRNDFPNRSLVVAGIVAVSLKHTFHRAILLL